MTNEERLSKNWRLNEYGESVEVLNNDGSPDRSEPNRTFSSGAKRDSDSDKLDFDGSLSPYAIEALANYMHQHNNSAHRSEENWKLGIPLKSYMKSLFRHFHRAWTLHYTLDNDYHRKEMIDALCGIIFNAQGYLHELTKPGPKQMLDEYLNTRKS